MPGAQRCVLAIGRRAIAEATPTSLRNIDAAPDANTWEPVYMPYRRIR